jgi:hypothetical protein
MRIVHLDGRLDRHHEHRVLEGDLAPIMQDWVAEACEATHEEARRMLEHGSTGNLETLIY